MAERYEKWPKKKRKMETKSGKTANYMSTVMFQNYSCKVNSKITFRILWL